MKSIFFALMSKSMTILLYSVLFAFVAQHAFAQYTILDNHAGNIMVTIGFLKGVENREGFISMIDQSGELSVVESDISDLSNPVFSISLFNLNVIDESAISSFRREVDSDTFNYTKHRKEDL